jgi:hypothetical protein
MTRRGQHLDAIEREFVEYTLQQAHPLVRAWRGTRFEEDVISNTKGIVSLIADDDTASQYADTMQVLALPPEHFKARVVEIGSHRFLAQIDFPDTSGESSFVAVFRASSPPGAFPSTEILEQLAAAFGEFAPTQIRFYHPAHIPLHLPRARVDQHFLAAPASMMAHSPAAEDSSRVALSKAENLSFYPRYVEAYEQMLTERPALRNLVAIESEESFAECLGQELLFHVMVDGQWSGTVAARRETLANLDAIYMVDIVLDRATRGQGLGPAVHQRLAQKVVESDPDAVISGTIAPLNVPSLKTARRVGRIDIGAWCWLAI